MKKRLHYAWVICACCAFLSACTIGLAADAFSLFLPYLAAKHGFTPLALGALPLCLCASSVLGALTIAPLTARLGLRRAVYAAGLLTGFGFLLLGVASGLLGCMGGALLVGLGCTYGGGAAVSALLGSWFRGRALRRALGITSAAAALGAGAGALLFTSLAELKGLAWSLCAAAVELLAVSILLLLLLRQSPEELGLAPLGEAEPPERPFRRAGRLERAAPLAAAAFCVGASGMPAVYYLAPRFTELGQGGMAAAAGIELFAAGLLAGRWAADGVARRAGVRWSGLLFPLCFAAGLALLAAPGESAGAPRLAAALLGLGFSALGGSLGGWTAELCAPAARGRVFARVQGAYLAGTVAGTLLPPLAAALAGGTAAAFGIQAALLAAAAAEIQLLYALRGGKQDR